MTFPTLPLENTFKFVFYLGFFTMIACCYGIYMKTKSLDSIALEQHKESFSHELDKEFTDPKYGTLSDTTAKSLKANLLKNELIQYQSKQNTKDVFIYLLLFCFGLGGCLITFRKILSLETSHFKLLELEFKIKELEYEKKLAERSAPKKYIRIR